MFCGLAFGFFLISVQLFNFLVQRKAYFTIRQQNHEKLDRFLVSNMGLNFQISQWIKNFTYGSVFSN